MRSVRWGVEKVVVGTKAGMFLSTDVGGNVSENRLRQRLLVLAAGTVRGRGREGPWPRLHPRFCHSLG